MNISKKDFVEVMNKLQESYDRRSELYSSLEKLNFYLEDNNSWLDDTVIQLLELLTGIPKDVPYIGSDISYFCWELDFGRNYEPGSITDDDGNEIDFSSAEKLYEYFESLENEGK